MSKKMTDYEIFDLVNGRNLVGKVAAFDGKSALKQFRLFHAMSPDYQFIITEGIWHMVSAYGSNFEAVPVKED